MKNIVITGLYDKDNNEIAEIVADISNLFYLNAEGFVDYNIQSKQKMIDKCGIEYLQNQEKKHIKACADFERTVISVPAIYLMDEDVFKSFKDSLIIYIKHTKNVLVSLVDEKSNDLTFFAINVIDFDNKNKILTDIATFVIEKSDEDNKVIANKIKHYLNEGNYEL